MHLDEILQILVAIVRSGIRRLLADRPALELVGRYEGFKSSGKLTNIENDALLEKITALYDYDIPKANMSSGGWRRELVLRANSKPSTRNQTTMAWA